MSDAQVNQEVPGQPTVVGKDHQFLLTGVGNQNLMVYSQQQQGILKAPRGTWQGRACAYAKCAAAYFNF